METEPARMIAAEASALIQSRKMSCEELVRSCLARIATRDAEVKAWLRLDPDYVIRRARELDKLPSKGPLHGLPWGVKDVIDTADYPTTQNSPIYDEFRVGRDAAPVAVVRGSGSLILGKTDTVEFASFGRKALTRNPYNPAHTPGGSSSGSGAAVGDFQVPLGFGTQTGGSHIRPASFNGIYGMKPSWNRVSREGLRMSSITLDTIGWYGRCVEDLIIVAEAFRIPRDPIPVSVKGLRVGLCRSPVWREIEPAGELALNTAAKRLARCRRHRRRTGTAGTIFPSARRPHGDRRKRRRRIVPAGIRQRQCAAGHAAAGAGRERVANHRKAVVGSLRFGGSVPAGAGWDVRPEARCDPDTEFERRGTGRPAYHRRRGVQQNVDLDAWSQTLAFRFVSVRPDCQSA